MCVSYIYCSPDVHNFFVFDLSGLDGTIASATLALAQGDYISHDMTETYQLYDVTTSITTLRAGSPGNPTGIAASFWLRQVPKEGSFTDC